MKRRINSLDLREFRDRGFPRPYFTPEESEALVVRMVEFMQDQGLWLDIEHESPPGFYGTGLAHLLKEQT